MGRRGAGGGRTEEVFFRKAGKGEGAWAAGRLDALNGADGTIWQFLGFRKGRVTCFRRSRC